MNNIIHQRSIQIGPHLHNLPLRIPPGYPAKGVIVVQSGLSLARVGHLHDGPLLIAKPDDIVYLGVDRIGRIHNLGQTAKGGRAEFITVRICTAEDGFGLDLPI